MSLRLRVAREMRAKTSRSWADELRLPRITRFVCLTYLLRALVQLKLRGRTLAARTVGAKELSASQPGKARTKGAGP